MSVKLKIAVAGVDVTDIDVVPYDTGSRTTTGASDPTELIYSAFSLAHTHFNDALFAGKLPKCVITLQRKNRTYGFFHGECFSAREGVEKVDEIAMNPRWFAQRDAKATLSTFAHEMVHQWQHHHGKPSRTAYHNSEWAGMMRQIGLMPSSTGQRGGAQTGQRVSHFVVAGGPFDRACEELLKTGFAVPYIEPWGASEPRARKKLKPTYACRGCGQKAWAKPNAKIDCGQCHQPLECVPFV